MNTKLKYLILFVFLFLLQSCGDKATVSNRHIPPPEPIPEQTVTNPIPATPTIMPDKRKIVVKHALKALGRPYKWGGQSLSQGFDCSGLVIYAHRKAGIYPPRMAREQFRQGRNILPKSIQPADLVFFKDVKAYKTIHVGIYIGKGMFVHAPGKGRSVTYARMNNPYFQKHFIGARTYL